MARARVDPAAMCVRDAGGEMPFAIDWRARTATLDPAGAALPVRRLRWGEKRALAAFWNQPAAFLESQFLALSAGPVPEHLREAGLALALWFDDPAGNASALDPVRSAEATLAVLAATGLSLDTLDERDAGEVEALARAAANSARAHGAPPRDERPAPEADDGLTVIRVVPDPPQAASALPPLPGASSAEEPATFSPPVHPETEAMRDPAPPVRSGTRVRGEAAATVSRRVKSGVSPMGPETALRAPPRIAVAVEPLRHTGPPPVRPADPPPVKASNQVAPTSRPLTAAPATPPRQAAIADLAPIRAATPLGCGASTAIPPRRAAVAPPAPCAAPIGDPSPIRAAAPFSQAAPGATRLAGAASITPPPSLAAVAPPAPVAAAPAVLDARLARLLALVAEPADRGDRPGVFEALLPADDWI